MRNVMQSRVSGVEAVSEGDYAYKNLVSPTSTDPMRVLGSTGVGPVGGPRYLAARPTLHAGGNGREGQNSAVLGWGQG